MKIKVLQKTASMNAGGIEKFLINVEEKINKDEFQFDYFLNTTDEQFYSEKIRKLGGRIFAPKWKDNKIINILNRCIKFYKFLKVNKYDIVHINEPLLASSVYAFLAKFAGVKNIIVHSHNDHSVEKFNFIQILLNELARYIIMHKADYYFACSYLAAKWLFGKNILRNEKYYKIANGIDSEKYTFNAEIRSKMRKSMNIENNFAIGHVGRFFEQKNHKFLLEIFKEFLKYEPQAILLLVGDGPLRKEIEEEIIKLKLNKKVRFLGIRKDVPELLMAMDIFVFPSLYEGLGIALIEAQASGLPVFCSKNVPIEAKITDEFYFVDLNLSAACWAKYIHEKNKSDTRKDNINEIINAGFDINNSIKWIEKFYEKINK